MREDKRGGRKVRPTLPFKLTKELGGDGDSRGSRGGGRSGGGGGGGSFKRKDRRKEEREAKKHKPRPQYIPKEERNSSKSPIERHNNNTTNTTKRSLPNSNEAANAAGKKKISRQDAKQRKSNFTNNGDKHTPHTLASSRFGELLPPAEDPEKILQRQLARKLGLNKKAKAGKKISFGDEGDGMDELMAELGGMDDILDSASDGEADEDDEDDDEEADDDNDDQELDDKTYLQMKRKQAAAAAVKGEKKMRLNKKYSVTASSEESESDFEEDDSDESDGHLGGLSELNHEHDDLGFENSELEELEEESGGDGGGDGIEGEEEGSSGLDLFSEEERDSDDDDDDDEEEEKEEEKRKSSAKGAVAAAGKYVPPAVRLAQVATAAAGSNGAGSDLRSRDEELVIRRVRGLLNRMAETNLQGIVGELAELYQNEGRSVVSATVASELLTAATEGPRASDRFAAVAAAAVSGLAGLTDSPGVIATFTEKIALALEKAMSSSTFLSSSKKKEAVDPPAAAAATAHKNNKNNNEFSHNFNQEDSLAAGNLVQVLAHLYLSGALKSDIVYSVLDKWKSRFLESDVVAMAGLLGAAGLALRASDPERMKEFVVSVHARAAECMTDMTAAAGGTDEDPQASGRKKEKNKIGHTDKYFSNSTGATASGGLSIRARVMLDLVVDIKNNRKRDDGRRKVAQLDSAAAKWLRGCNVGAVALGGITWKKVLTGDKRGHWWMPTAADAAATLHNRKNFKDASFGCSAILKEGGTTAAAAAGIGSDAGLAAPELLKLAAAMRMNTDSRRAVFCAVMGSEDAVDAFEKLLRLGLKGDQEREIVRVTVECCLNEAAYNPYYAQVLIRLCNVAKGHKITLQYCLWDHFAEVTGMDLRKITNLARVTATCISSTCLPVTMLKSVDFAKAFSAKEVLFWKLFFEFCLAGCKSDVEVAKIFSKSASQQHLGSFRIALGAFVKRSVGPWLAVRDVNEPSSGGAQRMAMLLRRCRLAEKALLSKV